MVIVLVGLKVSRHLGARVVVAAPDIKGLVLVAAVEDVLVASHIPADSVDGGEHGQAQPLALVLLRDGDFFYVTDEAAVVNAVGCVIRRYEVSKAGRWM